MNGYQRRILWLVAAASLVAGLSLSVFWDPHELPLRVRGGVQRPPETPFLTTARDGTELVTRYEWPDGQVGRLVREPLPQELAGLTREELEGLRPDWEVRSFGPTEVVVALPCQKGEEGFLGVQGGYVAVFDGAPGACARLRYVTDIALSDLPSFQVADLRRGIPFQREEELHQILEGLRAP